MKKEFKPSGNSRYAKRYQKRMLLAKECEGGFYINTKGRKCPLALPVLNAMSIIILCFMFLLQPVFAETSIAVKEGYLSFDNSKDSFYEGNTIMDNTLSGGGYVRVVKGKVIYRLDIDSFKTGNTFSESIAPLPYEKVDFKSSPIIFSIGRFFNKGLYGMAGVGILQNSMVVEQYLPYPFSYEIKDSPLVALTLGYDFNLDKHFYLFLEGRYLYSKADIYIEGSKNHTEDLSNLGVFGGMGWRF